MAAEEDSQTEDMLCSQEFLCTADFVTPVEQQFTVDPNVASKVTVVPVGLTPLRSKRPRRNDDTEPLLPPTTMRQRVVSPPCIRNPFIEWRSRQGCHNVVGSSRYYEEFHEVQEIGRGNFSRVYKVLKRLDGCFYAVKRSNRPLVQDRERREALKEVQALACLGYHENVVRYFSSWFENDFLYIQTELCDKNLREENLGEKMLVEATKQLLKALNHLHSHGVVHLDIKPDNIYVHKGLYKIGDFGSASRLDGSMSVEEGDARYLPMELINEEHDELAKADMFSLGATLYELARGSPLTSSGFSLAFQSLVRALMHPKPVARPTAAEALGSSLFKSAFK